MKYLYSGILLLTRDNKIIAMHRDDKPEIRDPGCYGIFGGAVEGEETPLQAAVRELHEETNLAFVESDLELFRVYAQQRDYLDEPASLYVFILRNIDPEDLEIYEGQGIKLLSDATDPNIGRDVREVFEDWFDQAN